MTCRLPWYEWLCHSNFSFCLGASHPEDYVQRAHDLGYQGIGLCDYDGVYGLVRAFRQKNILSKDQPNSDFKIFYGTEIHLQADHQKPAPLRDSLVLYALNLSGYQQICRILSEAHRESKHEAIMPLERLLEFPSHDMICLQPMRGMIRTYPMQDVIQRYQLLKDHFQENFYAIVSCHLSPAEDHWIAGTLELARRLDIPLLFSQDAYFHKPEAKDICDILQAIRLNKTLDQSIPYLFVNGERSLQSLAVLQDRYQNFCDYERIVRNSYELSQRFEFCLSQLRYHYPQEFLPPGYTSYTYLEEMTWIMAQKRYGWDIPKSLHNLLQRELLLVRDLGFADYFLTVWDIVCWARKQNILCQGRGSAANSAICFVLGITAVNPEVFDVLFERFISRERGDPPDIDVDFEHERREEVIQYIYQRYGRHRAGMVANVITFRGRSAMRAVGKALGIPESFLSEASQAQKSHGYHPEEWAPRAVNISANKSAELAQDRSDVPWDLWESLAERIKGFPHHMGIHSGGFVITQDSLDAFCAQEPASMEGRTVIQWSKDDIEYLNFFKIDVLALGMLTILRKTLQTIADHSGHRLSLDSIPADDPATYAMIQRGDTVGTFQIESRAQMAMLPRIRPRTFYDLVIQIGIIRPGPIQGGLLHPFLRRRQGLEPVVYPDPRLEPILRRTLGVPIFQEQLMRMAMTVGSFTPGEADQLRKHIGAWAINKDLGPMVTKLAEGMRRNGVKEHFIEQMMEQLKGFAHYGFPESHAVSFGLLAYASSYLKCHYPESFYTAVLNSQPAGFYSIHAIVQTARREGHHFMPLDILSSQWDCTLETQEGLDGVECTSIRLGLKLVRGLSYKTARVLIDYRDQRGCWRSLQELLTIHELPRHELVALAAANAFASFGLERRQALWIAAAGSRSTLLDEEDIFPFQAETKGEVAEKDFESFTTTLGEHPSKIIRENHWLYPFDVRQISLARDLKHESDRKSVSVFGLILIKQAPASARGMVFFTLEDETGFINLAFTPERAQKFSHLMDKSGFVCARGILQKERESHSILVEQVYQAEERYERAIPLPKRRTVQMATKTSVSVRSSSHTAVPKPL